MQKLAKHTNIDALWYLMQEVYDPEIPVLSVIDLGIIRDIHFDGEKVEVIISPTYSGCPAMDTISMNIRMVLLKNGFEKIKIKQQLSPAWTTDWMTEEGKQKLKAYGISPPVAKIFDESYLQNLKVECPLCGSLYTTLLSEFGSTACKALYKCGNCLEPFDYFKCH